MSAYYSALFFLFEAGARYIGSLGRGWALERMVRRRTLCNGSEQASAAIFPS